MKVRNLKNLNADDLNLLAQRLAELIKEKLGIQSTEYINEQEVMNITGLKSKGAILKLRQEGKIRYVQPYKRIIMYDKKSVLDFLSKHVKEPF